MHTHRLMAGIAGLVLAIAWLDLAWYSQTIADSDLAAAVNVGGFLGLALGLWGCYWVARYRSASYLITTALAVLLLLRVLPIGPYLLPLLTMPRALMAYETPRRLRAASVLAFGISAALLWLGQDRNYYGIGYQHDADVGLSWACIVPAVIAWFYGAGLATPKTAALYALLLRIQAAIALIGAAIFAIGYEIGLAPLSCIGVAFWLLALIYTPPLGFRLLNNSVLRRLAGLLSGTSGRMQSAYATFQEPSNA